MYNDVSYLRLTRKTMIIAISIIATTDPTAAPTAAAGNASEELSK